jgi:hypothetical protein
MKGVISPQQFTWAHLLNFLELPPGLVYCVFCGGGMCDNLASSIMFYVISQEKKFSYTAKSRPTACENPFPYDSSLHHTL